MDYSLTIVIPAYNEEEAISETILRCRESISMIIANTPVKTVDIIVVNDGSKDRTEEIALSFDGITVISFPENRGYGAALKIGFEKSLGNLVSFLDADGTCDPKYLVDLCNILIKEKADIAIGSRMNEQSQMPCLRKIGNFLFAALINFLSDAHITDAASGMRVIRKEALPDLYPLPDGLHFTPAMTARAVLNQKLKIVEVPMNYAERVGESKLSVLRDGFRFLRVICDTALSYRPLRFFGTISLLFFTIGIFFGLYPLEFYLHFRRVEDFMIYRLIFVMVAILTGYFFMAIGIAADRIAEISNGMERAKGFLESALYWLFSPRKLLVLGPCLIIGSIILNAPSFYSYILEGKIYQHWSYCITGAFLALLGMHTIALGILQRILCTIQETKRFRLWYQIHKNQIDVDIKIFPALTDKSKKTERLMADAN